MAGLLTGFEYYLSTGAPVVGAAVDYWPAVVGTPGGAAAGSTTTDGNGRWAFSPAAAGQYDVRVVIGARTRWYKGLSATSLQELYVNGALRIHGAALFDSTVGVTGLLTASGGLALTGGVLSGFPWVKLGAHVLGGAGASLQLSGLDTDAYRILKAIIVAKAADAVGSRAVNMVINGDTGANYDWLQAITNKTAWAYTETLNAASGRVGTVSAASGPSADEFGLIEVDIISTSGTGGTSVRKRWKSTYSYEDDGATGHHFVGQNGGTYGGAAAEITSLAFSPSSGNFAVNSALVLFGVQA